MEIEWLDALEARVHEAGELLRELKEANADLERRNAELEARLAAGVSSSSAAGGDWQSERDGIRRRVEKLAATLEELLEE